MDFVKKINALTNYNYQYSICSFVTDINEYKQMTDSFMKKGFTPDICEYIYIDNIKSNVYDAYSGINKFLQIAQGEFIIICHQDIELINDDILALNNRIKEITALDPNWAILANAGGTQKFELAIRITHPSEELYIGSLPTQVQSVDENFILIKNSANLSISRNLMGFHLYGTDLCLHAELSGYSAYVIDFNLLHKSSGSYNKDFYRLREEFIIKYQKFFKDRSILTTSTRMFISQSKFKTWIINRIKGSINK